jgi:hypothetical protein
MFTNRPQIKSHKPAIMAGSFWLSWLLLTPVSALPWLGPQETFSATATADWSPVPTNAEHELFKRGLYPVNLCGWQVPQDLNYLEKANSIAGKVQATKTYTAHRVLLVLGLPTTVS